MKTILKIIPYFIFILLLLIGIYLCRLQETQATKYATLGLFIVTGIYALISFLSFHEMKRTADVSEKNLRISCAALLELKTIISDSLTLEKYKDKEQFVIIEEEEIKKAREKHMTTPLSDGREFIFAGFKNIGKGTAIDIEVELRYAIQDQGKSVVEKPIKQSISSLEPNKVCLFLIYVFENPSLTDKIEFCDAKISYSDLYRKALRESKFEHNLAKGQGNFLSLINNKIQFG